MKDYCTAPSLPFPRLLVSRRLCRFHLRDKDEKYRAKLDDDDKTLFPLHSFWEMQFVLWRVEREATWLYYIRLIAVVESFDIVRSILCLTADRGNLRRFERWSIVASFLAQKAICSPTGKTFKHSAEERNCFSNNANRPSDPQSTQLTQPDRCSPIYIVKERKIRSSIKHTNSSYFPFSWLFLPFSGHIIIFIVHFANDF